MVVAVAAVMMTAIGSMMIQNTTANTLSTILMAFSTIAASTIAGAYLFPKVVDRISNLR